MEFYKKIFKSSRTRQSILKFLSFVPDKPMMRVQYRLKLGHWPNLKNPRRFTEKVQLYKLYYRNPDVPICSDKFAVRGYVERKGLGHILVPLLGVYDRAEDIDFSSLPQRFVIKTNDGGGGYNILICRDKAGLDIPKVVREVDSWLDKKSINGGREWGYSLIEKSVVLVEEFLEDSSAPGKTIDDFKFYCFHGRIFCVQHDVGRYQENHTRTFYDADWNNLHVKMLIPDNKNPEPCPANFEEMKAVALRLAEDFPHVRVDLYSVGGKVYFGELTFYTGAGYNWFSPDSFDTLLGDQFDVSSFLPKKAGNK